MDATNTSQLDALTDLLGKITSGNQYPAEQARMEIVLNDGTPVTIWQSSNDPGFKWTTHPGPPTTSYLLDTITETLDALSADTEPATGTLEFQLKNGAPVLIRKPDSTTGFTWEYPPF
ncbi:hypothetical protein ACFWPX_30135 [Nocardia sp. NPDC058518]|uniref:hypothetical protein n=1 Tax=Nocardia sp. NPDC058518 TaxID=3346534 RepID=UPI00365A6A60